MYYEKRKGKEYINNKLEYEGEYLYGRKWNGKGYDENGNNIYVLINGTGKAKEYDWNGKLTFEGEYLYCERHGKGKEYNYYGIIEFEGEYLKGKRNGKGKEYDRSGNLIFEGEYLHDNRKKR